MWLLSSDVFFEKPLFRSMPCSSMASLRAPEATKTTRLLHSGSKAQDKLYSRNYVSNYKIHMPYALLNTTHYVLYTIYYILHAIYYILYATYRLCGLLGPSSQRSFKFEAMMGLAAHDFLQWDAQQAAALFLATLGSGSSRWRCRERERERESRVGKRKGTEPEVGIESLIESERER